MKKLSLFRELTFDVLASAAVMFLAILWLAGAAQAADVPAWIKPKVRCVPTVTDFDYTYEVRGDIAAIVFWCDETDGLYTFWLTGTLPLQKIDEAKAAVLKKLASVSRDPILLEELIVRPSSDAELSLVRDLEYRRSPRCYVAGAAKTAAVLTATSQHTAGPPKLDAAGVGIRLAVGTPVTCADRLSKEPEKRYCAVTGANDSKGRVIPDDAHALCVIRKAPAEGWQ